MWTEALSKFLSPVDRAWATRAMSLCCRRNTPAAWLCLSAIWTSTGASGSRKGLAAWWPEYNRSTMSVRIVSIFLTPRTWRHNTSYWLEGTTSVFCFERTDPKPVKEHPSKPSIPWKGLYLSSCSSDSPSESSISISVPVLVMDTRLASVVGAWAGVCATERPSLKWGFP